MGNPVFPNTSLSSLKRIVWKLQSQSENLVLSPEVSQRAEHLVQGAGARLTGPVVAKNRSKTILCAFSAPTLEPGGVIRNNYKDRDIAVQITDGGFSYDGEAERSP